MDSKEEDQTREAIKHETLKQPLVSTPIRIAARDATDFIMFGNNGGKEEMIEKVIQELNGFAQDITEISLQNSVGSPDFTQPDWKQIFADKCNNLILEERSLPDCAIDLQTRVTNLFPHNLVQKIQPEVQVSNFTIAAAVIINMTSQVSQMLLSGNNPELLRMSPEEAAASKSDFINNAERARKDIGIASEESLFKKTQ